METQDKQELLSDLYALRASMSFVAVEREKIENLNREYIEIKAKAIEDNLYHTELTKDRDFLKQYDVKAFIDDVNRELRSANSSLKFYKGEIVKSFVYPILGLIISIGIAILSVYLILGVINGTISSSFNVWSYVIAVVGAIVFLFSLIRLIHNPRRDYKAVKNYEQLIQLSERDIRVAPELSSRLIKLDQDVAYKINQIIKKTNVLINILIKQFDYVIDFRDWKYLDLIVYNLQTKRADTLKEALQQVDRQIQTNTIVSALEKATREICKAVRVEIQSLNRQISTRLDLIITQNQSMIARNNILISQNDMQNALQSQISKSTQQLAGDVSYFRDRLEISY